MGVDYDLVQAAGVTGLRRSSDNPFIQRVRPVEGMGAPVHH